MLLSIRQTAKLLSIEPIDIVNMANDQNPANPLPVDLNNSPRFSQQEVLEFLSLPKVAGICPILIDEKIMLFGVEDVTISGKEGTKSNGLGSEYSLMLNYDDLIIVNI